MQFYYPVTLTSATHAEQLEGQRMTVNFFNILGVQPVLGRTFSPAEQQWEARVILISHEFWRRHFAADPNIVGKTLALDGSDHTIVGVMPAGMRFFRQPTLMSRDPSVWLPLGPSSKQHSRGEPHYLHVIARLKPGVSFQQAQSSMAALASRLEKQHPDFNEDLEAVLEPMRSRANPARR
jgi:hypothetical protein